MQPKQLAEAARQLCHRYATEHATEVLVAGIYGSVAREQATTTSDIELVIITTPNSRLTEKSWLLEDTPIGAFVTSRDTLEAIVSTPSLRWPFQMGVLAELVVIEGDPAIVTALLERGRKIERAQFIETLQSLLPQLVWESYGRIHSCLYRQDYGALHLSVVEVLVEMREALCLLNARWVTHDYLAGLRDSFDFPLKPKQWPELVEQLWWERDPKQTITLADTLVENFIELLTREGITVVRHERVADLVL